MVAGPERLCRLGRDLERNAGPYFEHASGDIPAVRGTEQGLFTSTCYEFAVAYVEAVEFMAEELRTKRRHLAKINQRLCLSGAAWATAEDKSTIRSI
ncbi:hypothetical protein NE236_32570 [Actinoallomurus purpureus]|uniref:hypothetical protein n=1 Tax=Actinoallomurus purpureus TaxID=478114 RepID=UPI0020938570|nr:hypothetical protein [Actinoallomurus purpureus]MCO6009716.1 hypothetical protein [Actinoallomurus purpureus]